MAIVPVTQAGSLGISRDTPFHELPLPAWSDGENVRFIDGAVESMLGHTNLLVPPAIQPRHIRSVIPTDGGTAFLVYLSNTAAYAYDGATETDITGTSGPYGATDLVLWNSTFLNGIPVFNNLTDVPQYWAPQSAAQVLQDLTAWPATLRARVIRAFKNFLVALYVTKSGTSYRHMVKWSDAADPGAVPGSWDETDPTTLAGEQDLADTPGILLDALPLGDVNVLYKEDAVWAMSFVGGEFVFQFRKLFEKASFGLMATNCVVDIGKRHALLSNENLVVHDGTRFEEILSRTWQREFFSRLDVDQKERCFLFANRPKREVWVCYPTIGGSGWCDEALVWNWKDGAIGIRDIPDVSGMDFTSLGVTDDTFDGGSVGTLDTDIVPFDEVSFVNQKPVYASPEGTYAIYRGEDGNLYGAATKTSRVERLGIVVEGLDRQGGAKVNVDTIKFLRAIYPKFESTDYSKVKFYVGSQLFVDGTVTWSGPFTVDPATGFKFDTTVSGRLLAFAVESTEDVFWRFWGMNIDVDPVGRF